MVGWWMSQVANHVMAVKSNVPCLRDMTLFFQWSLLSFMFIVMAYLLQIPKLRFTFHQCLFILILILIVHATIFLPISPFSIRSIFKENHFSKEGAEYQVQVVTNDGAVDSGDYISGSLTLQVSIFPKPFKSFTRLSH